MGKTSVIDVTGFLRVKSAWHLGLAFGERRGTLELSVSPSLGPDEFYPRSGLTGHGIRRSWETRLCPEVLPSSASWLATSGAGHPSHQPQASASQLAGLL